MSRPIDRILNSKIQEKKFFGRIVAKTGLKFVIETNMGRMQVDATESFTIGDNVVVSGTTIIDKCGTEPKTVSVLV